MKSNTLIWLNLGAFVVLLAGLFGGASLLASEHYVIGAPVAALAPVAWMFIRANCGIIHDRKRAEKRRGGGDTHGE